MQPLDSQDDSRNNPRELPPQDSHYEIQSQGSGIWRTHSKFYVLKYALIFWKDWENIFTTERMRLVKVSYEVILKS